MTDQGLLQQYARTRDEASFVELVRRHGGMVHRAAYRMSPEDAEDVAQAVFLLLARKAAKVQRYRSVAAWLHKTTSYCAANARRLRARERMRREAAREAAMSGHEASSDSIRDYLDQALARLAAPQRQVILLRYLEGYSLEETAAQLGISSSAVAKRSERGLQRLRSLLLGQGFSLSAAALMRVLELEKVPLPDWVVRNVSQAKNGSGSAGAQAIASASATSLGGTAAILATAATAIILAVSTVVMAPRFGKSSTPVATSQPSARSQPTIALTAEDAKTVAEEFLNALRDRDGRRITNLLAGDDPAIRAETATRYLAEFRDGLYARFPERLKLARSGFTRDMDGNLISATFDALPPTMAVLEQLQLRLQPSDERWLIQSAGPSGKTAIMADAMADGPPATAPATNQELRAYSDALSAWRDFRNAIDLDLDSDEIKDKPAVLAKLKRAPQALGNFADTLKRTDLAIDPQPLQQMESVLVSAIALVENADGDDIRIKMQQLTQEIRSDPQLVESIDQLHGTAGTLIARLDQAAEASHATPRPASFGAEIELTLGWSGEKFKLRGPVKFPDWLREQERFKQWQEQHDIRIFRTRDDQGNYYEVECMGAVKLADGSIRELIPTIKMYRSDGTLAAMADYHHHGWATSWGEVDETGRRWLWTTTVFAGSDEAPELREVTFFEADGTARVWQTREAGVVSWERLEGVNGTIKTLNQAARPR